jgi:hypothetical protein
VNDTSTSVADCNVSPAASAQVRDLVNDFADPLRTLLAFERGGHSNAALGALTQRLADQLGLTVAGA